MDVYGNIENSDIGKDVWKDYTERVEQYFYANDIVDEKKQTAIFLTVIGGDTYILLKSLMVPEVPSSKYVKESTENLQSHLWPVPIEITERYKFYNRHQELGESLKVYNITKLREMAATCNFGTFLESALRDRYVCGVRDESIRNNDYQWKKKSP